MKRFIFSILTVSVFFLGLGALVEQTGARFKSDAQALELVRKARIAIGGDAAINAVQSMRIVGTTTQTIKVNGVDKVQSGETEIAMQMPDKIMRMVKLGEGTGEGNRIVDKQVDVVVVGKPGQTMDVTVDTEGGAPEVSRKIIIKKDDGTTQEITGDDAAKWITKHGDMPGEKQIIIKRGDGQAKTWTTEDGKTVTINDKHTFLTGAGGAERHTAMKHNEMLRMTLSLLLSAPQGMDVEYTSGGQGSIDGRSCNIVLASFGGQEFKLFLDAASNLPAAISYKGMPTPQVVMFDKAAAPPADGDKKTVFFTRSDNHELVDMHVTFSDYRSVNGVQLPFKWTQTGGSNEIYTVSSYEINPANIAEKFQNHKVMVRTKKPEVQ